ncbi:hypothetical protein C7T36_23355 [Rhodococcus sp. AD45-ID]|nr:hypothetical protein SZ00_03603 [Rhodococcus sp. AD45]PSR40477.1 hypothetical protein C7T36_23355 [Rhodococcus sp. AD45-ID]
MEKYKITLPEGTSTVGEFESDRDAIAHAVKLNHGCSDSVSVSRIDNTGKLIPTMLHCDSSPQAENHRRSSNSTQHA